MAFGNLATAQGMTELNSFLEDKSYIFGFVPTQTDVDTFKSIPKPPAETYVHVLRWYNHIISFSETEQKAFAVGSCPFKTGTTTIPAVPSKKEEADEDDDVDLFASDEEEDAEAARVREERLQAYAEKKSKKPELIAKSSIVLDVKPWDDETDMKLMEESVRSIVMDGLVWGASKLVPVGYGINKLQVMCVVEDAKVSVDLLQEEIEKFEDYVQSVDIAAFNKI